MPRRVQFGYGLNYLIDIQYAVIVDVEAAPARTYDKVEIYYHSRGVAQNDFEALKWFHLAAEQGSASAQLHLGIMHAEGHGVPQDFIQGAKWYRMAADQGYPQAMYYLGLAYARGEGVAQENVSAHMWLNLAAGRFATSETRNRALAVRNRDLVAAKMTAGEILAAQTMARDWRAK